MKLTFDDGPNAAWTPRVLDALGDLSATFYALGPPARAHADIVAAVLAGGHSVELHGSAHLRHPACTADELRRDTLNALEDLAAVGVTPTRWRAPWGLVTEDTRALASQLELELVGWTVDTHDWRGDTAEEMQRAITPQLTPESVVLMHDGLGPGARRADCAETVRLIERLADVR